MSGWFRSMNSCAGPCRAFLAPSRELVRKQRLEECARYARAAAHSTGLALRSRGVEGNQAGHRAPAAGNYDLLALLCERDQPRQLALGGLVKDLGFRFCKTKAKTKPEVYPLIARSGSIVAARRAGTNAARVATMNRTIGTTTNDSGSRGVTPKRNPPIQAAAM